jgi:hypothetical protein
MRSVAIAALLSGSAADFAPASVSQTRSQTSLNAFVAEDLPGVLAPVGFFDPAGFAAKADEATLKRYREAELTHGRVAMLASLGFLVGKAAEGSSFLCDASISGPAITHLPQVPPVFWLGLATVIGAAEKFRAERGWVDPCQVPVDKPGLLQPGYAPGDLGVDPLGLAPSDAEDFKIMQTKELQNGRIAMLAADGVLAQEAVNGKGILENLNL